MRAFVLKQQLAALIASRNLSLWFGCGMLCANLLLTMIVFSSGERVVIVPPGFKTTFWTENHTVSQTYLEETAFFFAKQILDVSPATAAYQRDLLLRHVEPAFYPALKKKMVQEEAQYKKDNLSMSFKPLSAVVNVHNLTVTLTGLLHQYVANKLVQQTQEVYEMTFSYRHGQLLIKNFTFKSVQES